MLSIPAELGTPSGRLQEQCSLSRAEGVGRRGAGHTAGMRRREFLAAVPVVAAGAALPGLLLPRVAEAASGLSGVPTTSRQVITVAAPSTGTSSATLAAWQRGADGAWSRVLRPLTARVGSAGIGAAREGSRLTPAGTMRLDQAFGRRANPGTRMPYFVTDRYDWWDENPSSPTYNLHVRRSSSPGGASENLYLSGTVYDHAVNMAWNPQRVPGAGSAFFLHVSVGSSTAGCVAVPLETVQWILRWLDPAAQPVIDIRVGSPWVPPAPWATRLSQRAVTGRVPRNSLQRLSGALFTTTGDLVSGAAVEIWARTVPTATYRHVGNALLRSSEYSWSFRATGHQGYQVRFRGAGRWHAATAPEVRFDAR